MLDLHGTAALEGGLVHERREAMQCNKGSDYEDNVADGEDNGSENKCASHKATAVLYKRVRA